MQLFHTRLFLRLATRNWDIFLLKVLSLAITFASTTLIILFSIHEYGYDRFHSDHQSVFRMLQRNNQADYTRNRLSAKIPTEACNIIENFSGDSIIASRVKVMNSLNVVARGQTYQNNTFHAADISILDIFTFTIKEKSASALQENNSILLSQSAAIRYFGTSHAVGNNLLLYSFGDSINFAVAAVYSDFPSNSHERFDAFILFDSTNIRSLNFNPLKTGLYGRVLDGDRSVFEHRINASSFTADIAYTLQPVSQIHFGPRVMGEEARHGDQYSVIILLCVTGFIVFLSLSNFINLTALTLPHRAKEIAIKKLAGTSQARLVLGFAKETLALSSLSLILGIMLLIISTSWIDTVLAINPIDLILNGDQQLWITMGLLLLVVGLAPVFTTFPFTKASPTRLISTDTIHFPQLRKIVMFLQLGISIFLILGSIVIRRQINYSIVKEPGQNHDQVVHMNYPPNMTEGDLFNLRRTWQKFNPNIVDVMATSQLPNNILSKELNSECYIMTVDRGFKDFIDLQIAKGHWFKPNDGDSIYLTNVFASAINDSDLKNNIGTFEDFGEQFNQPEKPVKLSVAYQSAYNYLFVRILEVNVRRTLQFLSENFDNTQIHFMNPQFEQWLLYQDKLNDLSGFLAVISIVLSCLSIYGLSIGIIRDKQKDIAIHKLFGASNFSITRILASEFTSQVVFAILIFGPLSYIFLSELLRSFVYATELSLIDAVPPLLFCVVVVLLICIFQTYDIGKRDLSKTLKG